MVNQQTNKIEYLESIIREESSEMMIKKDKKNDVLRKSKTFH